MPTSRKDASGVAHMPGSRNRPVAKKDGHPWREHLINENHILLEDEDRFVFEMTCMNGTVIPDHFTMFTN
jgi:hypothetical protein